MKTRPALRRARSQLLHLLLAVCLSALSFASSTALAQGDLDLDDFVLDEDEWSDESAGSDDFGSDDFDIGDDLDDLLDEEFTSLGEDSPFSSLTGFQGFVEFEPRVYFRDRGEDRNDEQLLVRGEFELDFRFHDRITGYARPRILIDLNDGDLDRFEPFEGYLTLEGEGWDLRAGQFVENWGIVDTYNPIDVVNRRDFASDLLDAERLGELGVRGRWLLEDGETFGEPTLSAYWIPVWRPTEFAPEDQRFAFGNETTRFDEDQAFEPDGAERSFFALRLAHTLSTGPVNADVQYLVARGPERFPTLYQPDPTLFVPAYYGVNSMGIGFRAVPNGDVAGDFLAEFTFKAEVVYKDPYEFSDSPVAEPDDHVATVIGFDREFPNFLRSQDQLTVTLEYAREDGADDPSATLRPFLNDLILRVLWEANDFARSSVELRSFFDFENEEKVFEAIFERQLRGWHEDLKLSVQLQLFDPPETGESLFDLFPNNSSLAVGFRIDF